MKKYTYILVAGIVLAFSNCTTNTEKEDSHSDATHDQHHHGDEAISLNNGQKWEVNDEMMPHIANMEVDMTAFESNEEKDYKKLAADLQENIDLLTSSCTMTGQAHDELHKWLVPYIGVVGEMAEAKNMEDANAAFKKIQKSFMTFNTYFQ